MTAKYFLTARLLFALSIINYGMITQTFSQSKFAAQKNIETAGWKTFIVQDLSDLKIASPPGKEASQKELAEVKAKMTKVDQKIKDQIQYWDAGVIGRRMETRRAGSCENN